MVCSDQILLADFSEKSVNASYTQSNELEALDYYYRGYGYQMVGAYDQAISDYETSLQMDPANDYVAMFIEQSKQLKSQKADR